MKFDFSNLNPGTWFDFDNDKDGGKVCLKILSAEDSQKVRDQCIKKENIYRDGKQYINENLNEKLFVEMVWDICIVGWENIFDAENKPIPCTKEFKLVLMNKSVKFAEFVTGKLNLLRELKEGQSKEEEKN